ncbi:hypothetical protein WA556_004107 [Blastocystis sp. ATCC 50177/Nand II]
MGCPNRLSEDMIRHYMSQHFGEKTERIMLLDYGSALSHSSNKRTALYRIHLHYNAMMRRLFEERNHSHVLVVEDDLQLAPTALLFAQQVVPALDADPSLVCLSLFNDNAEAEDRDPLLLHRSAAFPNLGLLFNRRGYDRLWRNASLSYHTNGWDHWVRQSAAAQDLECVFPALPRLRHLVYAEGTTVNSKFKSTIGRLPLFEDATAPDLGDVSYLLRANYDRSLLAALLPPELVESSLRAMRTPLEAVLRGAEQRCPANRALDWSALYDPYGARRERLVLSNPYTVPQLKDFFLTAGFAQFVLPMADENYHLFTIPLHLSRAKRGAHRGILHFTQGGRVFFLLDRREAWYALPEAEIIRYDRANVVQLSGFDESCSEVCAKLSAQHPDTPYVCDAAQLQFLNRCSALVEHFPCEKGCYNEVGQDLPGYVAFATPQENGVCLFSFDVQPLCEYAMTKTQRLCVCTPQKGHVRYNVNPLVLMDSRKEMQRRAIRKARGWGVYSRNEKN